MPVRGAGGEAPVPVPSSGRTTKTPARGRQAGTFGVFPGSGRHGGGPPARVSIFIRYQVHIRKALGGMLPPRPAHAL